MEIILSSIAVILCWLFIEFVILFFLLYPENKDTYLSVNKFNLNNHIWKKFFLKDFFDLLINS